MIPTLPELWFATVYVAAYVVAVIFAVRWWPTWRDWLWERGDNLIAAADGRRAHRRYEGRHRPGLVSEYVPVSWRDEQEQRIAAALDDPIVSVDTRHYDQSAGSQHYQRLKPIPLQLAVEMALTRTETLPLRGAAPIWAEIDDEMYAEANA